MAKQFPTLPTVMHYSIARACVLVTSRTTWAALMVGCLLVLAVMGTSAAWRARSGNTEDGTSVTIVDHPLVEVSTTSEEIMKTRPEALDGPTAPSFAVHTAPTATPAELPDTLRTPVSATAIGEERAQCDAEQRLSATQCQPAVSQTAVDIAEQRQERVRVRKATHTLTHPPRRRKTTASARVPAVTVISVSSTAALIQRGHWRQVIHRGARLDGWTVTRLTPTGLMLRRGRRQAVLPLSFAVRTVSTR
jgi:hypothetical protein